MGNYRIWISTDNHGNPRVGAAAMDSAIAQDILADQEHIYPSQMAYRVTAMTPDGPRIMTRTDARELGYTVLYSYPRADGSLSIRR